MAAGHPVVSMSTACHRLRCIAAPHRAWPCQTRGSPAREAERIASLLCAGASWARPTLQQRQHRALGHSGRLHACNMRLVAAGAPSA